MTEQEWLTCLDPDDLVFLARSQNWLTERKLRLFACACCRCLWKPWAEICFDENARRALELAELFCDGKASHGHLRDEQMRINQFSPIRSTLFFSPFSGARSAISNTGISPDGEISLNVLNKIRTKEADFHCKLLREIFGNPFRQVAIDPAWKTSVVMVLAQAAYCERQMPRGFLDPVILGILADALEDAGCIEGSFLEHLRSPGLHVRGCWALDLVLGKR